MTYKEYDNIFIENSEMPCKIPIDLMTRNLRMVGWHGWKNTNEPETGETRDFMDITLGAVREIGTAHPWGTALWEEYVIGVGDYIYSTEEDINGNIWIFEYCISTSEKKNILVFNNDFLSEPDFIFLSYLEPHKILVAPSSMHISSYSISEDKVYLLDFTQMMATLEIEATGLDAITILYTQTINGDLMAFMGGIDSDYENFSMYCKNITDGGGWSFTTYNAEQFDAPGAYWYENWQVCNNRYLCSTIFLDSQEAPPSPNRLQIICYDMETETWQESNIANAYDFYPEPRYWYTYWTEPYYTSAGWGNIMATDMTDGKLYIAHYGFSDWSYVPISPPYSYREYTQYFQFFGVYDPSSNSLSVISSPGWDTYDTSGPETSKVIPCVYTTPEHAYFLFFDNTTFYGTDMSILSSNGPTEWRFGSIAIMDKNIVFYEILDYRTIQAKDLDGNVLKTWDLGESFYSAAFDAVGNGIVVEIDQNAIEYIRRQFLLT